MVGRRWSFSRERETERELREKGRRRRKNESGRKNEEEKIFRFGFSSQLTSSLPFSLFLPSLFPLFAFLSPRPTPPRQTRSSPRPQQQSSSPLPLAPRQQRRQEQQEQQEQEQQEQQGQKQRSRRSSLRAGRRRCSRCSRRWACRERAQSSPSQLPLLLLPSLLLPLFRPLP